MWGWRGVALKVYAVRVNEFAHAGCDAGVGESQLTRGIEFATNTASVSYTCLGYVFINR